MTAMQQAFTAAGVLPVHVIETDGRYYTDPLVNEWWGNGDKIIEIPEQEISWVEGRYVHACPIPTGYLEQLIKVGELQQQRMTSHLRFAAQERMTEEGYTSTTEFAQAMMREHLQETAHISAAVSDTAVAGDRLVRYGHLPPAIDKEPPAWLKAKTEGTAKPRVFHFSDMVEKPQDLVDQTLFDQDIVAQMRALVSLSDWDPALAYAQLKEWDALCAMYERLMFNTQEYGTKTRQELARIYREADAAGDEIPRARVERLNEKLQGLRVQYYNFQRKFAMAKQERERAVVQSGIDFGPYNPIAERAKMGAAAHRAKRLSRVEVDLLNALPAEELQRLHRQGLFGYKPRRDGIDGVGADTPAAMGTDE